jgi:hypothetical protein
MARSVSGGAPPPSRAPEDPFKTASQKASSGPTLERRSLCTPSGQKPRARPQPARTGRGPSPAHCGRSRGYQPSCAPADDVPVACPIGRSTPGTHGHSRTARLTCVQAGRPAAQTDLPSNGSRQRAGLQFGLQFDAVRRSSGKATQESWSSLNRSEHQRPELLMRFGPVSHCQGQGLSQFLTGLTGRYRIMASMPDTWQDTDLPIRIPAHGSDTLH